MAQLKLDIISGPSKKALTKLLSTLLESSTHQRMNEAPSFVVFDHRIGDHRTFRGALTGVKIGGRSDEYELSLTGVRFVGCKTDTVITYNIHECSGTLLVDPPRKLFTSYSVLVCGLQEGTVSQEDLDNGLFAFGSTKQYALCEVGNDGGSYADDEHILKQIFQDNRKRAAAQAQIVSALSRAEEGGRIVWLSPGDVPTYDYINRLLALNGFPPLTPRLPHRPFNDTIPEDNPARLLQEAGITPDVLALVRA